MKKKFITLMLCLLSTNVLFALPASSSSSSDCGVEKKILKQIKHELKKLNGKLDCDVCGELETILEQTKHTDENINELSKSLQCLQTNVITQPGTVITERGVYCLANDLILNGEDAGITIASDCVVLDLAGHLILGSGPEIGIKVDPSVQIIRILNGFVESCAIGLNFGGINKEMSFESLHFSFCNNGIVGNGDDPLDCHTFFITNCECVESTQEGCIIDKCSNFSLSRCFLLASGADGLVLRGCLDVGINNSVGIDNQGNGFTIDNSGDTFSCLVKVEGGICSTNNGHGLEIAGTSDIVLVNGFKSILNGLSGFTDQPGCRNISVCNSNFTQNSQDGLDMNGANGEITACVVRSNLGNGILLGDTSLQCDIEKNKIFNNAFDGLNNLGTNNTILQNVSCDNGASNFVNVNLDLVSSPVTAGAYHNVDCTL